MTMKSQIHWHTANAVDEEPLVPGMLLKHIGKMNVPFMADQQQVNTFDFFSDCPQINITDEEHQQAIKEAAREARLAIINNLDPESREKLKKKGNPSVSEEEPQANLQVVNQKFAKVPPPKKTQSRSYCS